VTSLVIDTNIVFSTLVSDKKVADFFNIFSQKLLFVSGDFLFTEIEKHWNRIVSISNKPDEVIREKYNLIKSHIHLIEITLIPDEIYKEAIRICSPIDKDDIPYVAICIFLGIPMWTGDNKLRRGLERQGYFICTNTEEIAKKLLNL